MTLKNAIEKFDREYRNSVPADLKREWIAFLDASVYNEIFLTHEDDPYGGYTDYSEDTPEETVLLVPDPYSRLYLSYLAMKTDLYLGDVSRYNNDRAVFTSAYGDFEKYYNRTHLPLKLTDSFNV